MSIAGSRENDSWEMKVWGPNGFERSYTLVGSAGEHQPVVIGNLLLEEIQNNCVAKKRGNPNWGKPEVNTVSYSGASSFEEVV